MNKFQTIAHFSGIIKLTVLMVAIVSALIGCKKEEDNFVSVSGISDVPTAAIVNTPLALAATVTPSDATNQTIVWTVKDAGATRASITDGNMLIAADAGTVIVTASIANGETKNSPFTRDFTITVNTNFTVSGVMVTPETSDVPKGYALGFTATVTGDKLTDADKAVTWTVTGGTSTETAITANGTLIISPDETSENLIITASSTVDNSKNGTATVKVYELQNFREDCTEGSEWVEFEYMGEKIFCHYVDGFYITQGDIIIGKNNQTNAQDNISPRAAKYDYANIWDQGKVYYFIQTDGLTSKISSDISSAMEKIKSATDNNIKFIELKTPEARDYKKNSQIGFIPGEGNKSWVGKKDDWDYQELILDKSDPSALHEICHALGLIHEHSRSDRDTYVKIHYENIIESEKNKDGKYTNFDIWTSETLYSSFDIQSVMMYHSYAYAKKPQKNILGFFETGTPTITIVEKGKDTGKTFNRQRESLMDGDKYVLNKMYSNRNANPDIFIPAQTITPTENSCLITGEVLFEGYPVNYTTEYGICYKIEGSTSGWDHSKATSRNESGRFSCGLPNLKPNTTYEASTYYIYNGTTFYLGNRVEFKTLPETVAVTRVTLSQPPATVSPGSSFQLTATIQPTNAANKSVTWRSDNTARATINNTTNTTCTVTIPSTATAGTVTIIVTTVDGGHTASCAVTVQEFTAGLWKIRLYRGVWEIMQGIYDYNMSSSYTEWNDRFSSFTNISINGNNIQFTIPLENLSPGQTPRYCIYTGILNSAKNLISGTYVDYIRQTSTSPLIPTYSGNFEMWKIE